MGATSMQSEPTHTPEHVTIVVTSDGRPQTKIDRYLDSANRRIIYLMKENLHTVDGQSPLLLVTAGRLVIDRILIDHSIADWADSATLQASGVTPERVVHHDYDGRQFVTTRDETWETAIRR